MLGSIHHDLELAAILVAAAMLVSSASFPVWTCLLLVVTEVIPTVTYMDGRKMMNFDSFQKKNIWGTYGPWQETTRESHKVY